MSAGNDTITNGAIDDDVDLGAGDDSLTQAGSVSGSIYGRDGNDTITAGMVLGDVDLGSGNDSLTETGVVGGAILGGDGDDTVHIVDGWSEFSIDGGDGNDTFVLGTVGSLSPNARLVGGAGFDTLALDGHFSAVIGLPPMSGVERLEVREGGVADLTRQFVNLGMAFTGGVQVDGTLTIGNTRFVSDQFAIGAKGELRLVGGDEIEGSVLSGSGRVTVLGDLRIDSDATGLTGQLRLEGGSAHFALASYAHVGSVVFGTSAAERLDVGSSFTITDTFAPVLVGFGEEDRIELLVPLDDKLTLGPGNVLTIGREGSSTFTLKFDPSQDFSGKYFHLGKDAQGNTVLYYNSTPPNTPPVTTGPVATTVEEGAAAVTLDALANTTDPDAGQTLTLVDVPGQLPPGVTYNAANHSFTFDPSLAGFDHLAEGQFELVYVPYGVTDGVAPPQRLTEVQFFITGVNDAPAVAGPLTAAAAEDGAPVTVNALQGASDVDDGAVLSVVDVPAAADLPAGVSYDAATHTFRLDPSAYNSLGEGETRTVRVSFGVSDGIATTPQTVSWTISGANDAPVVTGPVVVQATEGATTSFDVFATTTDADANAVLTAQLPGMPAFFSYDGPTHTLTLDASDPSFDHLAEGQVEQIRISYPISDGHTAEQGRAVVFVTGVNDAPTVAGPVTGSASEGGAAVTLNALAGAADVDDGTVLAVTGVPGSLPAGVSYDADARTFRLDPADPAYNALAAGQSVTVSVSYAITDGLAPPVAQTASWTVTGTNDGPTAVADSAAVNNNQSVSLDVLFNDTDPDVGDTRTLVSVSGTTAGGHVSIVDGEAVYTADAAAFDDLRPGETTTDSFSYVMRDAWGAQSTATTTITVAGVFVPGIVRNGGSGNDTLNGLDGDDQLNGGNGQDVLIGGRGYDALNGGNGEDRLDGGNGADVLDGGNGKDSLTGGAGDDRLAGGNGDDRFYFGAGFGHDVVTDFHRGDQLVFSGVFTSFADLLAHATQVGSGVVITYDEDNAVTLENVSLSSLRVSDFLFA